MTQLFVETMTALGERWELADKGFSSHVGEIGQLTLRKLLRAASLPFRLALWLRRSEPELSMVFLSCDPLPFLSDCVLLGVLRLFRVPYAVYLHGGGFRGLQRRNWLGSLLTRSAFSRARAAVILTPRMCSDIEGLIDPRRIFVVPNAIEMHRPLARDYTRTPVKVLYLSNYMPQKGALEFLKAAAVVAKQTSQARFVLAGAIRGADYFALLRQFIETEGLGELVDLRTGVYGADKRALLADADIFVFPSRFETFGLVNLEAMCAGLPVIASSVGGMPDVVSDGETGFTVDPADSALLAARMLELVNSAELRQRFGQAGRARFERLFTLEVFRENWARTLAGIRALI